ncbi:hypothetical protein BDQ94DRAFT_149670 [Aspergillus welwitschiae]|uniref:Uncharacterized protein n=1 Tax=Aspergillus welwitschiae TaxID=1341132 RepID=A0A3F3PSZ0_9EURO|nr:hypothetical protein BDQ94DRAFT_149670 [Aspergillus welwitschiae]RDH29892.1 hypothetical protein BDQ94DRAFT_149670 [Aspergillus welwitschiae]
MVLRTVLCHELRSSCASQYVLTGSLRTLLNFSDLVGLGDRVLTLPCKQHLPRPELSDVVQVFEQYAVLNVLLGANPGNQI